MSLNIDDLDYEYPEELVALEPNEPCRVMYAPHNSDIEEVSLKKIKEFFNAGDVLVINNSGVKACRVFHKEKEVLFLKPLSLTEWEVLFVLKGMKEGQEFPLPGGVNAKLVKKGRPHVIELSKEINDEYFQNFGEPALPPYIQKLRTDRKPVSEDQNWYQTDWYKDKKSLAAPTASLHFKTSDLVDLKEHGVIIKEVTLNVGLGTFLPLTEENISEGKLHKEFISVDKETIAELKKAKLEKRRIWCIGTTALRVVESIDESDVESVSKETDIFIYPGYEFKWVSGLLTNFHQPKSSLMALVMAFSDKEKVLEVYEKAVEKRFRLFSYGDLSVWTRPLP